MRSTLYRNKIIFLLVFGLFAGIQLCSGQNSAAPRPQEPADRTEIPVLLEHLPDWPAIRPQAKFANNTDDLIKIAGERPELRMFDFAGGTEAAVATYPAGELVLVEFPTPQASVDVDTRVTAQIAGRTDIAYRRIGNYNAFVFDVKDGAAASALLDQIQYEKDVRWLYGSPNRPTKAEREFTITTAGVFVSTLFAVLLGMAAAIVFGTIGGFCFFLFRERERAKMTTFSDAGGMVRLNLDGLTPDISVDRLLGD